MQPLPLLFPYDFLAFSVFIKICCVYQYHYFFPGFNIGDNRDQVLITGNNQFTQFSLNGDVASGNHLKDEVIHEDGDDNEVQCEEDNNRSSKAEKRTSSKMQEEERIVRNVKGQKQNKENAPHKIGDDNNGTMDMVEIEEASGRDENEHLFTGDELDNISESDLENNSESRSEDDHQNEELTDSLEY